MGSFVNGRPRSTCRRPRWRRAARRPNPNTAPDDLLDIAASSRTEIAGVHGSMGSLSCVKVRVVQQQWNFGTGPINRPAVNCVHTSESNIYIENRTRTKEFRSRKQSILSSPGSILIFHSTKKRAAMPATQTNARNYRRCSESARACEPPSERGYDARAKAGGLCLSPARPTPPSPRKRAALPPNARFHPICAACIGRPPCAPWARVRGALRAAVGITATTTTARRDRLTRGPTWSSARPKSCQDLLD